MTLLMKEQEKFEEGLKQGMLKQIKVLKELNIENSIIIEKVTRDYEVSKEEVEKYL